MERGKGGRPLSVKVGDRFNRLVIESLERERTPGGKIQVRCHCRCDCGGTAKVVVHHLKDGSTKSCGCLSDSRKQSSHPSWTGHGEIPGSYWCGLKYGAQRRGIEFDVSIEDAWALFLKQKGRCALTGDPIRFSQKWKTDRGTASLDRLNSSGSYQIDNVQWVDKALNEFKMSIPNEEFVALCVKVAMHAGRDDILKLIEEKFCA